MKKTENIQHIIREAVKLLHAGKIIAIPTETVYGLAADANNEEAIKKVFKIKGRPTNRPLTVMIENTSRLTEWAIDIPKSAYKLTNKFWPGPLTIILKRAPHVLDIITAGQNTIGLRCPNHPITQQILQTFQGGIAAPSANRFGHVSPTTAEHVRQELGDKIDFIVDGGSCTIGIESTIIDLSTTEAKLLRPGMISSQEIAEVIGTLVLSVKQPLIAKTSQPHYAPITPIKLITSTTLQSFVKQQLLNKKIAVLARQNPQKNLAKHPLLHWITLPNNPKEFAKLLYDKIHELDQLGCDILIIEDVPDNLYWLAIKDKLQYSTNN